MKNCREAFTHLHTVTLQKDATYVGTFSHSCAGNTLLVCDKGVRDTDEATMYVCMYVFSDIKGGVAEKDVVQQTFDQTFYVSIRPRYLI